MTTYSLIYDHFLSKGFRKIHNFLPLIPLCNRRMQEVVSLVFTVTMENSSDLDMYQSVCANTSDSNVTSELWLVEDRTSGLVSAVFLLLFLVIGLPWNLLVIVTIVKQKLYTQPTIILLLSLVITDLLLLVFHLPLVMVTGFSGEYVFGSSDSVRCSVCSNTGFVSLLCSLNSVFAISLMSIDRFLFIYKPLHYDRYLTKWRTVVAIAVAWLIAVAICILPLASFGTIIYIDQAFECKIFLGPKYGIFLIVVSCLAILPVVVSNAWVCCIVQRNILAIYKVGWSIGDPASGHSEAYRSAKKKRHEKERHLYLVFGALLCSNIVSWLPIIVTSLMLFSGQAVPQGGRAAAQVLFLSQVTVHPIIETALLKEVRVPLLAILFCCCAAVKAKLSSNKIATMAHDGSMSQGTENATMNTCYKCCTRDSLDTCGVAVLFLHFKDSMGDTENGIAETLSERLDGDTAAQHNNAAVE